MGSLTGYLQERFAGACPTGWRCRAEVPLVDAAACRRLGLQPRADVMLERVDGSRRIWIEFEISRADPVANHAKFATARFFEGTGQEDAFVSMSSRHIVAGRAALAAGTAMMMRALGVPAFQVDLLPGLDGEAIKQLNALPRAELVRSTPFDAKPEVERVMAVTDATLVSGWHRIHKADNAFTVGVNVRQWNREMADEPAATLWGRRAVQYFVFDPPSELFAPSKYCAFVPAPGGDVAGAAFRSVQEPPGGMRMMLYAVLGEEDARFDGHVARKHLEERLGYRRVGLDNASQELRGLFERWVAGWGKRIALRGSTELLVPRRG